MCHVQMEFVTIRLQVGGERSTTVSWILTQETVMDRCPPTNNGGPSSGVPPKKPVKGYDEERMKTFSGCRQSSIYFIGVRSRLR